MIKDSRSPAPLCVSVSTLMPMLQYAAAKGCELDPIFRQLDLSAEFFQNPNRRLELARVDQLYCAAKQALGIPHLGLRAGSRLGHGSYNLLQHLLLSCNTLAQAFAYLRQYYLLLSDEAAPQLLFAQSPLASDRSAQTTSTSERQALLRFQFSQRQDHSRAESALAAVTCWIQMHCGQHFKLDYVAFQHAPTCYPEMLEAFFRCPVHFNQPHFELAFAERWLQFSSHPANPSIVQTLEAEVSKLQQELLQHSRRWSALIRDRILNRQLRMDANQQEVARALNLSVRTLNRYLQQEGVAFKDLLTEARMAHAKQLLADPRRSIDDIANAVGYAARRSFDRAFLQQQGKSPAQFRQDLRQTGEHQRLQPA